MMTEEQVVYCRLELFCIYDLEECQDLRKERCLLIKDDDSYKDREEYNVYLEKYQNFTSFVNRVIELNEIWQKSEFKRCWTEKREENIIILFLLYNRWRLAGEHMLVGISDAGWMISGFSCYTKEYENNLIRLGKPGLKKERLFALYLPEWTEFSEKEFIPKEAACSLIKEWLDTGTYIKYFPSDSIYENYRKNAAINNGWDLIDLEQIPF